MFSVSIKEDFSKKDDRKETDSDEKEDEDDNESTEKQEMAAEDFQQKRKENIEKVIVVFKRMKESQNTRTPEGYITDDFREDIYTIFKTYHAFKKHKMKQRYEFRREVGEQCLQYDTVDIFCNIMKYILQSGYRDKDGKSVPGLFKPLHNILGFLQNMTDFYPPIRKKISENVAFYKVAIQKLHEWATPHLNKELKENDNKLLGVILGMTHNVAQDEENVPPLRKLGIIDAVKPYIDSHVEMRRLSSLAILADVVNEKESAILQSTHDAIAFTIKCLSSAIKSKQRRCFGWSAKELARTITMIAKNDNNKRTLVKHGVLPLLVELAETAKNATERREAVGALWTLSFDQENRAEMISDPESKVIDVLYKLHKSEDSEVRQSCHRALWTMRDELKKSERYKSIGEEFIRPSSRKKDSDTHHVMLSYNWGHQTIMKDICKNLRNNGIDVWMDIDDMQGSTLQAMANAVEKANIVLICYSQKYKNSDNCRAEAEYAFQLKKKIIPLRMEKGYNADGWLGFIIGAKLFFDFSGKYPFENKIAELIKEVKVSLNHVNLETKLAPIIQSHPSVAKAPVIATVLPPMSAPPSVRRNIDNTTADLKKVKKWTPQHVGKWLDKNRLPRNLLQRLTGIEIAFLHVLVQECPEVYYKTIAEQFGVKDTLTMAKMRFALEELNVNV